MDDLIIKELNDGFRTACIDKTNLSNLAYRPQFVSNDFRAGKKVLSSIEEELKQCDSFCISVAFITSSGIEPLLMTLKELEKKGIKGRILTTNYLNFSEPIALKKLHELSNVHIKMFDTHANEGFHTKGYIFRRDDLYRIIIGSSNMTKSALTTNHEWNTKIISAENGEMASQILEEFDKLWNSEYALEYSEFIDPYSEQYNIIKHQQAISYHKNIISLDRHRLKPNSMQTGFISNLRKIISEGEDRALLISATGTGKTYASAFAARELEFSRILFVTHRTQLSVQTMNSYENVFGNSKSMGFLGNGKTDYDSDIIFANIQTLCRDEHLNKFKKDAFNCIILDEAHHSSSNGFQKILDYFKPEFWLGMTATPDKRDDSRDGKNIYEIFNYQIAYEIRLQKALEENLLCPFHYFGITDLSVISDETGNNESTDSENFSILTSDERVRHIIENAAYYGYSGKRLKGLIFCRSIKEAEELSIKLNEQTMYGHKLRTMVLTGEASLLEREEAFERLEMDSEKSKAGNSQLDYILSVDLLNEGVDLTSLNQIIMLRPTQSPIVFVQQLGRGLRKSEGKEYVVILDFIGNYTNNFLIPIALYGDRTYNKDNLRRFVMEGDRTIPGESTIHFDEISRRKILSSVDNANFSDIKLIKENYLNLRNKIGRIPSLCDFDNYGEMDVFRIFDNNALGSYYKFLVKYEKEYQIRLNSDEEKVVEFISKKFASGKRIHELIVLKNILRGIHTNHIALLREELKNKFNRDLSECQKNNIVNILTNEFPSGTGKNTYSMCVFLEKDGNDFKTSDNFINMLSDKNFSDILSELIDFGMYRYEKNYSSSYKDKDLVLYKKYTYEDVCRLLNWEKNEVPLNIGGYKFDKKTMTFPVFINYDKDDEIAETIKYRDRFINNSTLIAISKSGRTLTSEDVQNFINSAELGISVDLFVRKNKDDKISKEFYYLGTVTPSGNAKEFIMPNTDKQAVEIEWLLDTPVREDLYEYIINT